MKFTFKMGIHLVVAPSIARLVAIGGAYQLSVTERVKQAQAEAQSQHIIAKLEDLVSAWLKATGHSCRVFTRGKDLVRAARAA